MNNDLIKKYLAKLQNANSNSEISSALDEIIPILKAAGVSIPELLVYLRMNGNDVLVKSQDHQNSIANSGKAQVVVQMLLAKLNK